MDHKPGTLDRIAELELRLQALTSDFAGTVGALFEMIKNNFAASVHVDQFVELWERERALHEVKRDLERDAAMNKALFGEDEINVEEFDAWAKQNADALRVMVEAKPKLEDKS